MSGNCKNSTCSCFQANVFGGWQSDPNLDQWGQYLHWDTFRGERHLLKRLVMKIRPVDFDPEGETTTYVSRIIELEVISFISSY